ncbi:hypothetical protein BRE01_37860 [Brevibacillus reuszeri]|uniref:Uncharacterized protein n=1 Tax=Brevibacillus reuszeri TaxID=54915 RepID=A0ABQ0TQG2_9BACL|nr:hypothetical protein BRE01_37860 [Brevibacillus reuszeri]
MLKIHQGHYIYTGREETLVRFLCTEGKSGARGYESEITIQAFATWAKAVV